MSTIPSSGNSDTLSHYAQLQTVFSNDSLIVPNLTQDEVFALIDDFYDSPPPQSTAPVPGFGDDDFADMMEKLEEIERNTQLPESDLLMPDVSSPPHREPSAISPAIVTARQITHDEQPRVSSTPDLPIQDPPPSLPPTRTNPFESVLAHTSPGVANVAQISVEHQLQTPTVPELPVLDTSLAEYSSKVSDQDLSPALPSAPTMALEQHLKTPTLPRTGRISGSRRVSSVAPSTGGHRSSMQGEMRREEAELAEGDLGMLPPFPDLRAGGRHLDERTIASTPTEGHRQKAHDLSESRDIGEQLAEASAKHSPTQDATSGISPLKTDPDEDSKSPLDSAVRRDSAYPQPSLSPSAAPAIRPRHLPWVTSSEHPRPPIQKTGKAAKTTRIEESDSSLTDVSLSAILATSPEHLVEQIPARTKKPPRNKQDRRDSIASSLDDSKPVVQSPAVKSECSPERKPAKPRATPKRKRNNAPASSASPEPTKAAKIAKTTAKSNRKPAPVKNDLKGIIGAGILSDVLGSKGPRQTRGQQKAIENTKPEPALTAKRRHTDQINYKE